MHDRPNKQNADITFYCYEFQALAGDYLESKKDEANSVASFFKPCGENKIAELLLMITNPKINFSINTLIDKITFLEKVSAIYYMLKTQLNKTKSPKQDFLEFWSGFTNNLKSMLYSVFSSEFGSSNEINLNYLKYYITALSSGNGLPTNYDILKNELINTLCDHIINNKTALKLIKPFINSINNDDKGINKHAMNPTEKFNNMIKFTELFQDMISKSHSDLSMKLNSVLCRALQNDMLVYSSSIPLSRPSARL
jgi:hypothetical protein